MDIRRSTVCMYVLTGYTNNVRCGHYAGIKAKRYNKSEKLFGYSKRYPKCDIRNINLRNPKHFVFYIAQQVIISEKVSYEVRINFWIYLSDI